MKVITAALFAQRLLDLTRGGGRGLPRRNEDRHVLFKSATLTMGAGDQTEAEVNRCIMRWQAATGLATDYVSWRRYLVDAGYLTRDRARTCYRIAAPDSGATGVAFDPEVDSVDVERVMAEGRRAQDERRAAWQVGGGA